MSKQEIRKIYRTARKEDFPESLKLVMDGRTIEYSKVRWTIDGQDRGLRYGSNPHQKAALYKPVESRDGIGNVEWIKWGKEGPSATNIEDGSHGLRIVRYFDGPAAAVMKHLNPSGVAVGRSGQILLGVYVRARDVDPRADIRLGKVRTLVDDQTHPDIVVLDDGSLIFEDSYSTKIRSENDLKQLSVATRRLPTEAEYTAMLHSWWTACEIRSNAVVFWKDGVSLAIGTGQQDRIGAIEACIEKAYRYGHDLNGSVMASDGFLPKLDNVDAVAKEGVSAIIQPGGSVEDPELVKACDEHGISMVLTGERSFRHF